MKLYLACGMDRIEGCHHVDINPACHPDQVFDLLDLSQRWPWSGVKDIQIKHYIENIPHGTGKDHFIRFFERCWHLLLPDGTMTIRWPWYASIGAVADPTHQRLIAPLTFHYLSREWLRSRKIDHYEMACDFEVVSTVATVQSQEDAENEAKMNSLWNAAQEGITVLRAIK